MGTTIRGLDEWIDCLETLPERAQKAFPPVVSRGALQVKLDWKERWREITHPQGHIPHLLRSVGYDTTNTADTFSAVIGVDAKNRQAFLARIIESGTLTSAPHPAAVPALDAEDPKFVEAVAKVAVDLLDGTA